LETYPAPYRGFLSRSRPMTFGVALCIEELQLLL
jgi:hypothetical protein